MHFLRLFLHLFRNYAYYYFIFPKINERGAGIRAEGGWKIVQKLIRGGGDDHSVLESSSIKAPGHMRERANGQNGQRNGNGQEVMTCGNEALTKKAGKLRNGRWPILMKERKEV